MEKIAWTIRVRHGVMYKVKEGRSSNVLCKELNLSRLVPYGVGTAF